LFLKENAWRLDDVQFSGGAGVFFPYTQQLNQKITLDVFIAPSGDLIGILFLSHHFKIHTSSFLGWSGSITAQRTIRIIQIFLNPG
jgi:hypothetical protein